MCHLLPQKLSFVEICRYSTQLATDQGKRTVCMQSKQLIEEQNKNGNILHSGYHKENLIIQL